jgi:hypothetical protein
MQTSAALNGTPCHLRLAHPADESFIFNSYVNSYGNYQLEFGRYSAVDKDVYKRAIHQQLTMLIPHRDVIVACSTDDPEIAIGYVIGKDLGHAVLVDYVYVKHPVRRYGIANYLLADLGVTPEKTLLYTHQTRKVDVLIKHQKRIVSYVPPGSFTLFRALEKT